MARAVELPPVIRADTDQAPVGEQPIGGRLEVEQALDAGTFRSADVMSTVTRTPR